MPESRNPKRILIVEDDEEYRQLYRTILAGRHALEECSSAEEALGLLAAAKFGLVILDIKLFGMTGLALLQTIRTDASMRGIPVVICSSLPADPALEAQIMKLGAAGRLMKPFAADVLLRLVEKLIAGSTA